VAKLGATLSMLIEILNLQWLRSIQSGRITKPMKHIFMNAVWKPRKIMFASTGTATTHKSLFNNKSLDIVLIYRRIVFIIPTTALDLSLTFVNFSNRVAPNL
jgi:hypothetical protein